jgi:hypothetical protein
MPYGTRGTSFLTWPVLTTRAPFLRPASPDASARIVRATRPAAIKNRRTVSPVHHSSTPWYPGQPPLIGVAPLHGGWPPPAPRSSNNKKDRSKSHCPKGPALWKPGANALRSDGANRPKPQLPLDPLRPLPGGTPDTVLTRWALEPPRTSPLPLPLRGSTRTTDQGHDDGAPSPSACPRFLNFVRLFPIGDSQ